MNLEFTIKNKEKNHVVVTGLSKELKEYTLEDDFISDSGYKYSESVTLNIFYSNKTLGSTLYDSLINEHDEEDDISDIFIEDDGFYTVYHIIVPTLDWFLHSADILYRYNNIFIYHDTKLYRYTGEVFEECSAECIILHLKDSNLFSACKEIFFTHNLRNCLVNYCKNILNGTISKCLTLNISDLTFKRDFIWMTINVILYCIELGNFYEALRILEEISYCNGFCNESHTETYKSKCPCGN